MSASPAKSLTPRSLILEYPPLEPAAAVVHAHDVLSHYCDPSDLHADLEARCEGFLILDARSRETYARGHIPGAINLPHREITAESLKNLSRDKVIVTYCDGIGCNASTKAALKLAGFGFHVKELIGGLDWWIRDGYAVSDKAEGGNGPACGC